MDRHVEDVNVYEVHGGELVRTGRGVTHYRVPFQGHMVGERLRHELIAAGVPVSVQVTAYPTLEGGQELDIALPGDDERTYTDAIARALDAHEGTEAGDHKALVNFAGSVHDAARRLLEGGQVSQAERDVVLAIAVQGGLR